MSSTRHQKPGSDHDSAPERYLSDPALAGIRVGLNTICRVARIRREEEQRAMVWLHNYARMMQITADTLSEELDLDKKDINEALTYPHYEKMALFVERVWALRAIYEASLPRVCSNRVSQAVTMGMSEGYEDRVFSLIIGPERIGKSTSFLDEYLRNYMDCAILVNTPESRDMRSFVAEIARACGINVNENKKNSGLRDQIFGVFAQGVLKAIYLDEFQRSFPGDLENQYPEKIELTRSLWDNAEIMRRARRGRNGGGGLGIIGAVTPQFEADLATCLERNKRWKPGQFEGRLRRTHTPATLEAAEVREIALLSAHDFPPPAIEKLIAVTLASPGLLGFMENVIGKTRFLARHEGRSITEELVLDACRKMLKGTPTEIRAKQKAAEAAKKKPQLLAA